MLELSWRPRAHLDRESIAIYIGVECGRPQAALSVMQRIDKAIERVREMPDSGGHFKSDSLAHKEYRTVVAGKYTVFYRYDETTLTIYRILHQRRDIGNYGLVDF